MLTLKIERYGVNGEGIATDENGKIVFVPYAIKDEIVSCDIQKTNKDFSVAKLEKVIKKSKLRCDPVCPYFYDCGGCQLQHIQYDEQLKIKKQIVINNIKKIAKLNVEVRDVIANPNQFFYRNHINFAVAPDGKLGFFKYNSHNVLEVKKCYIANKVINDCITILKSYFFDNNLKGYDYNLKTGQIKHVDIKFSNALLITIVSTINELPNLKNLIVRLNCLNIKYGIFLSVNKDNNSLIYGELKHLTGLKCIELFEGDFISPFSFMQVNPYMQNLIYNDICDNIDGGIVIDAYSGRGVLSSYVAKKANFVYAIEIEKSSCKDAENLVKLNGINNISIICDDCKNAIGKIDDCIDYVIIDPPRKGASQQVIESVMDKNPKKIFYLSCASNTLARDLTFISKNYHIVKIQPYDMFPNTSNIETLVILEKNE